MNRVHRADSAVMHSFAFHNCHCCFVCIYLFTFALLCVEFKLVCDCIPRNGMEGISMNIYYYALQSHSTLPSSQTQAGALCLPRLSANKKKTVRALVHKMKNTMHAIFCLFASWHHRYSSQFNEHSSTARKKSEKNLLLLIQTRLKEK